MYYYSIVLFSADCVETLTIMVLRFEVHYNITVLY